MKRDPEKHAPKVTHTDASAPWAPCLTGLDWATHKVEVGSKRTKAFEAIYTEGVPI